MKKGAQTEIGDEIAYPVLWGLFNKSHKKQSKHIIYVIYIPPTHILEDSTTINSLVRSQRPPIQKMVSFARICPENLDRRAWTNEVWDPGVPEKTHDGRSEFSPPKGGGNETPEMGIFPRRNFFSGKSRMREVKWNERFFSPEIGIPVDFVCCIFLITYIPYIPYIYIRPGSLKQLNVWYIFTYHILFVH